LSALSLRRSLAKLERKIQDKTSDRIEFLIAEDEGDLRKQMDLLCKESERGMKLYSLLLSDFSTSSATEKPYANVTREDIEKHMSALCLLN